MALRHPSKPHRFLPTLWLVSDERMGEGLWDALAALPPGSGVLFRHVATDQSSRTTMLRRIAKIARRRRLVLVRSDDTRPALAIGRAHSLREANAARRAGADLVFVSPIHATRTHPGARPLGPLRAAAISRAARLPAIALGGMTFARFARLKALGFVGWAAIDGLTPRR